MWEHLLQEMPVHCLFSSSPLECSPESCGRPIIAWAWHSCGHFEKCVWGGGGTDVYTYIVSNDIHEHGTCCVCSLEGSTPPSQVAPACKHPLNMVTCTGMHTQHSVWLCRSVFQTGCWPYYSGRIEDIIGWLFCIQRMPLGEGPTWLSCIESCP